jgi:metal-sulfur cluster biosynthetic enzyme
LRRRSVDIENLEIEVRAALAEVIDPETGLSIMRMGIIHDLAVAPDGSVSLIFRPSSPVCPMAYALGAAIKKRLETIRQVAAIRIRVENFERAEHLEGLLQGTIAKGKVN